MVAGDIVVACLHEAVNSVGKHGLAVVGNSAEYAGSNTIKLAPFASQAPII